VGLPEGQRHSWPTLVKTLVQQQVRTQKFGPKNISLHINVRHWSTQEGKELFGIVKFDEFSGGFLLVKTCKQRQ
jgi:hypothetical protein